LDPKEQIFFDRALPDEVAYYEYFKLEPDEKLVEYLKTASYKKIFIMDLLPLDSDYARTEDREAQLDLHNRIIDVYKKRGEPIVFVPVLPVKERVQFLLDHLD
jgi:predicted ATPase